MISFSEFMDESSKINYVITLEPTDKEKYNFKSEEFKQVASSFKQACNYILHKNPSLRSLINSGKAHFTWKNVHSGPLMAKYKNDINSRGYEKI